MELTLVIHIVAAAIGLGAGYVALYSPKGGPLHRASGRLFVWTMIVMALAGTAISAARGVAPEINVPVGVLSAYLVVTGVTALRPRPSPWLAGAGIAVALGVGATMLVFGIEAIAAGGSRDGMPAFPFLLFAVVGLLASAGDVRVLRAGGARGAARVVRHLWRMSFALFIAALSFFVGQAKVIPAPVRIPALLALPVVAVLATLVYWVWRVGFRRRSRSQTSTARSAR